VILVAAAIRSELAEEAGVVRSISPGRAGNAKLLPPTLRHLDRAFASSPDHDGFVAG